MSAFALKPTAGVQPLGGSLQAAAMDTSSGVHFVAVVFPGRIAVYKFENGGSSTTPGASWESNSCCLGEVSKQFVFVAVAVIIDVKIENS